MGKVYQVKKRKNFTPIIWAIFLATIMISSILGFVMTSDPNTVQYKGINFYQQNGIWQAKIKGIEYQFQFHPIDVASLNISSLVYQQLTAPQVILTFNANTTALADLDTFRFNYGLAMQDAGNVVSYGVLSNTSRYSFPVVTCSDATSSVPVVVVDAEGSKLTLIPMNSCLLVSGSPYELARLGDYLHYRLLGVIGE
ncbi:hypothetical protein HZB02_02995 [Candidatus Woesearchaeota archaeon]|nr:hypothetical protein [Candidatus Woesearchaeota archaeon]